ncbi:hypothetical protein SAMN05216330_110210 [Bradyrhizobium sp. Ghvi]|uniref:hypothetical protein n=1 Tax=Bradyrhizobium sp. Ghvi TaxID=1855319 RepID=UPI0008ED6805|nr:hypothetical protein [Bradyrhizobium sp. Ghvi]SFP81377.1 hypothetical protein SAMN05216330_110210 [Bradyrhizobium sp. Ghvi]
MEVLNGDYPREYRGSDDYKRLRQLNWPTSYKDRFIKVREALIAIASATDADDKLRDFVPLSLRRDHILNGRGYHRVAEIAAEQIGARR